MQGLKGKIEDISHELEQQKIDIAVLTKTKKKGSGTEFIADYLHIYSGVKKSERAKRGISIMIKRKHIVNLHHWETTNERIITANMQIKGHRITIIGAYGPNTDASQSDKEEFYEQLNDILIKLGNQREIILLGDMNARVGNKRNDKIVGQFGEEVVNENGVRLIHLCKQHNLQIQNGFFQHKRIHRYTWHQDNKNLRSVIDCTITKQNSNLDVQDTRAYRGINCGSDHFLVISKIMIKYKKGPHKDKQTKAMEMKTTIRQYKTESLADPSISILFKSRLDQKLNTLTPTTTTDALYKNIT